MTYFANTLCDRSVKDFKHNPVALWAQELKVRLPSKWKCEISNLFVLLLSALAGMDVTVYTREAAKCNDSLKFIYTAYSIS